MVNKHKFITYQGSYSKPYRLQINQKDVKPYRPLILERFETLEEAIIERDKFLSKYEDRRYKGVTYCKHNGRWKSFISVKGKSLYLGSHETQEEAKEFRNKILTDLLNL